MSEIWAVILAAGESKRMKRQKLLLPLRGKTVIENSIENVLSSKADHILVVMGSHYDEIFDSIRHLPVRFCYNEHYRDGMLSSVKCAVNALPPNCEAFLIFPGDQPLIAPEIIDEVIKAYRNSDKGLVIPTFENRRGHPILIDGRYSQVIEDIKDHEGLRVLAVKFPEDVLEVPTLCKGILKDMDTQEEYEEVLKSKI